MNNHKGKRLAILLVLALGIGMMALKNKSEIQNNVRYWKSSSGGNLQNMARKAYATSFEVARSFVAHPIAFLKKSHLESASLGAINNFETTTTTSSAGRQSVSPALDVMKELTGSSTGSTNETGTVKALVPSTNGGASVVVEAGVSASVSNLGAPNLIGKTAPVEHGTSGALATGGIPSTFSPKAELTKESGALSKEAIAAGSGAGKKTGAMALGNSAAPGGHPGAEGSAPKSAAAPAGGGRGANAYKTTDEVAIQFFGPPGKNGPQLKDRADLAAQAKNPAVIVPQTPTGLTNGENISEPFGVGYNMQLPSGKVLTTAKQGDAAAIRAQLASGKTLNEVFSGPKGGEYRDGIGAVLPPNKEVVLAFKNATDEVHLPLIEASGQIVRLDPWSLQRAIANGGTPEIRLPVNLPPGTVANIICQRHPDKVRMTIATDNVQDNDNGPLGPGSQHEQQAWNDVFMDASPVSVMKGWFNKTGTKTVIRLFSSARR